MTLTLRARVKGPAVVHRLRDIKQEHINQISQFVRVAITLAT